MNAEELIARGYRRVSNKYRMVARIDDPNWIEKLAVHLNRSIAELYVPGTNKLRNWPDFYRRVLSKDHIEGVPQNIFDQIPLSDWDDCGYMDIGAKVGVRKS